MFEREILTLKLLARIDFGGYGDSCWLWTGAKGVNRYGYWFQRIKGMDKTKGELAHRLIYRLFVDEIPQAMTIDHLCHTRLCVNPDHLELVSRAENSRRGSHRRVAPKPTHCIHGHEFTPANTYVKPNGARACKECVRRRSREYQRRRGATPRSAPR